MDLVLTERARVTWDGTESIARYQNHVPRIAMVMESAPLATAHVILNGRVKIVVIHHIALVICLQRDIIALDTVCA